MNIGVVLAAGDGKKFGSSMNKQYLKINGKEMLSYPVFALKNSGVIDKILLVVDKEEYKSRYIENKYNIECLLGGKTRNRSIRNAIDYIQENYSNCQNVIFLDSVRPLVSSRTVKNYINSLYNYEATITIHEIVDSLSSNDLKSKDREKYKFIQTPEAFRFYCLREFDANSKCKAIVNQCLNCNILKVNSDPFNMKITYAEDLFIAEQLMRLDYYSMVSQNRYVIDEVPQSVLLLGGSGGIGSVIKEDFEKLGIKVFAPSHTELNLVDLSVDKIRKYMKDESPDAIINAAAVYFNDNDGIVDKFDIIFNVNVKSNLVLIEYAKTLKKKVNIVLFSSSSSTRGRSNLTNYSAAKAALNSIVESEAPKLVDDGVYLNAVVPEKVNTPLLVKLHKQKIDPRELLEPEDVLNVVKFYCSCKEFGKLVHIRKGF